MSRWPVFGRLANPLVATTDKIIMFVGLAYPFQPIDLIPDNVRWVGHLDNFGFPTVGLIYASLVMRAAIGANVVTAWFYRRAGDVAVPLSKRAAEGPAGRFLLRLLLGRAPTDQELSQFMTGLWSGSHAMPPLLRGIACVPAAAPLLSRAILLNGAGRSFDDCQLRGNLVRVWTGPKVRFLHIEKTAGSSLVTVLAAQFHPTQIHCQSSKRGLETPGTEGPEESEDAHRNAAFVWGHHDLPSQLALDRDARCYRLCLLRDPSERLLSLYYFWRGCRDVVGPHISFAQRVGLLEFLRTGDVVVRNDIDNVYVRRLTGLYATADDDLVARAPDLALVQASGALSRLDFVGLSERLEECLGHLGGALGFTPPDHTPRVNVQSALERNVLQPRQPTAREPITPAIQAEIERLTRLDSVLYQKAKTRFEALVEPNSSTRSKRPP